MKKILLPFLLLSLFFVSKPAYSAVDTLTIAQAIAGPGYWILFLTTRFWVIQLW